MQPDWQTEINRYCEAHSSPEPAHLQELVRHTWLNTVNPRQLSGHLQGRLLALLAAGIKSDCILEIGTFTGYSALCLAEGLSENGVLHSIEADPELAFKAKDWIAKTPHAHKIKVHAGDGLLKIPELNLQPNLIFVDAEKKRYREFCEMCLPILAPGGLMLFDNTLWSMKVLDENERATDADTRNMHAFNVYLNNLPNVSVVMLPLRDGLTLLRKNIET